MSKLDYAYMKVLVIDDQPFLRTIIKKLLQQMGFKEIYEAEDGASGLEAHNKNKPDLIICDIEMEPVDGLVFLQTLRQAKDSEKSDAAVVFLSQHTDSHIIEKAQALNVNAFVVKPPSFDKLKNRIEFALGQSN